MTGLMRGCHTQETQLAVCWLFIQCFHAVLVRQERAHCPDLIVFIKVLMLEALRAEI